MSVRKAPARAGRRSQTDRWKTLKGAGFWAFMMAACFTFGLLVVSPLLNMAGGVPRPPQPPATQTNGSLAATGSVQSPEPSQRAPGAKRRGEDKSNGPGISIVPGDGDATVQKPDDPEQGNSTIDDKKSATPADEKDNAVPAAESQTADTVDNASQPEPPRKIRHPRHRRHKPVAAPEADASTSDDTPKADAAND